MKRLLYTLLFLSFAVCSKAQIYVDPPVRDSIDRAPLSFYEYSFTDVGGRYCLMNKANKKIESLTGRYKFWDGNGRYTDMELLNGVAIGNWQFYSSTFQGPIIESTVSFVDGYKNGPRTQYSHEWDKATEHFRSYISGVDQYDMGKMQNEISYWEKGQLIYDIKYDKEGRRHGLYVYYNRDGSIDTKGEYSHGYQVGIWERFYSGTDTIKELKFRKDGVLYTTSYHKNSNLHISQTIKNSLYEGDYLNLSETGDTIEYHFYKKGIEHGNQVKSIYMGYDQPRVKYYYHTNEEGVIQGAYTQRFENGKLRIEGQYDDKGVRTGVWKYYVDDGRLYRTETIENGWVTSSSMRQLIDRRKNVWMDSSCHLEKFPEGTTVQREEEIPFFLFSE